LGLQTAIQKNEPDYQRFRAQRLHKNLQIAEHWDHAHTFTLAISRKVRNALAHVAFDLDPLLRKVTFRNNRNRVVEEWPYNRILDNCRELFAAIFVLIRLGVTLQIKIIQKTLTDLIN
jgi:hypothetical protein